jgi:hypothetical protein
MSTIEMLGKVGSFCCSILYGRQGKYNICSIPVEFPQPDPLLADDGMTTLFNLCNLTNMRRFYVFSHEMGHAAATRLLSKASPEVIIFSSDKAVCRNAMSTNTLAQSIIVAAGPITGAISAGINLNLAPLTSRSLVYWLGAGALFQMLSDFEYIRGSLKDDRGDWAELKKLGQKQLYLGILTMVSVYALSLYLAINKFRGRFRTS